MNADTLVILLTISIMVLIGALVVCVYYLLMLLYEARQEIHYKSSPMLCVRWVYLQDILELKRKIAAIVFWFWLRLRWNPHREKNRILNPDDFFFTYLSNQNREIYCQKLLARAVRGHYFFLKN